jgi:hypothetical protein
MNQWDATNCPGMNGRNDPARRHRLAAIAARSTRPARNLSLRIRPRRQRSLISSPSSEARPECASEQTRFDAQQRIGDCIGIPHAALDGFAQRLPNAPAAPHAPAHESSADRLRVAPPPCAACCRTAYQPPHAHTAPPEPRTLTHTGSSHSCNANTSAPRADPVANASACRSGRTHNPMPSRVMKNRPKPSAPKLPIQMLQSPWPGPATILLPNRGDLRASCTFGSTHRASAGARPTRPKPSRHQTLRTTTDTSRGRG